MVHVQMHLDYASGWMKCPYQLLFHERLLGSVEGGEGGCRQSPNQPLGLLLPNSVAKMITDCVNLGVSAAMFGEMRMRTWPPGGAVVVGKARKWTASATRVGS